MVEQNEQLKFDKDPLAEVLAGFRKETAALKLSSAAISNAIMDKNTPFSQQIADEQKNAIEKYEVALKKIQEDFKKLNDKYKDDRSVTELNKKALEVVLKDIAEEARFSLILKQVFQEKVAALSPENKKIKKDDNPVPTDSKSVDAAAAEANKKKEAATQFLKEWEAFRATKPSDEAVKNWKEKHKDKIVSVSEYYKTGLEYAEKVRKGLAKIGDAGEDACEWIRSTGKDLKEKLEKTFEDLGDPKSGFLDKATAWFGNIWKSITGATDDIDIGKIFGNVIGGAVAYFLGGGGWLGALLAMIGAMAGGNLGDTINGFLGRETKSSLAQAPKVEAPNNSMGLSNDERDVVYAMVASQVQKAQEEQLKKAQEEAAKVTTDVSITFNPKSNVQIGGFAPSPTFPIVQPDHRTGLPS